MITRRFKRPICLLSHLKSWKSIVTIRPFWAWKIAIFLWRLKQEFGQNVQHCHAVVRKRAIYCKIRFGNSARPKCKIDGLCRVMISAFRAKKLTTFWPWQARKLERFWTEVAEKADFFLKYIKFGVSLLRKCNNKNSCAIFTFRSLRKNKYLASEDGSGQEEANLFLAILSCISNCLGIISKKLLTF